MIHASKTRVARISLAAALLVGLATFASARSASASSKFPEALQKSLAKRFPAVTFCVPTCAACHLTTAGGPGMMNVFGKNLETKPANGNLPLGNGGDVDKKVDDALTRYFAATPAATDSQALTMFPEGARQSYDADADGISDYDEFAGLDSPSIPLPGGVDEFCPADTALYGCFARVAAAPPPVDRLGLFSAGLAVLGLAAFRRLKRRPRARLKL
jgi:hypothetical protein